MQRLSCTTATVRRTAEFIRSSRESVCPRLTGRIARRIVQIEDWAEIGIVRQAFERRRVRRVPIHNQEVLAGVEPVDLIEKVFSAVMELIHYVRLARTEEDSRPNEAGLTG